MRPIFPEQFKRKIPLPVEKPVISCQAMKKERKIIRIPKTNGFCPLVYILMLFIAKLNFINAAL